MVAADKGTATFSDIANEVAETYGFWLGDAFASGGSAGYDHKKMGITARGAWEAVKRHFRELGRDIQNEPFTVVGIGDMSGDVFGNGMLLSRRIRLIGAFNHRHIFIDPDADAEAGFAERERLFALPRSGWSDYDAAAISPGGGVFDRRAKAIALTPEIRRALDIAATSVTPNELISALLRAPVDLLWNGGIGTYVKAGREAHADVGDRANDPLRIDASALRCKTIGEGGNLGLTQAARIEAALRGVRVNNDAIDNSAGVDCSDHEVNIKILLGAAEAAGELDREARNSLLAAMTDDVAERCLADNYLQTQGIGVIESLGVARLDLQQRLMQALERSGRLDRAVEDLPDDQEIEARRNAGQGLTRPEISVLYAYAKISLYHELLASDLPDDPFVAGELERYFPPVLAQRYSRHIQRHRLRREIVATVLANSIINRASMVFALMAQEETGAATADVARAYAVTRAAFDLPALWSAVESLDNRVAADVQTGMIVAVRGLMEHSTLWLLRHRTLPLDCGATARRFTAGVRELMANLEAVLPEARQAGLAAETAQIARTGVPEALARRVASAAPLHAACAIVEAAHRTGAGIVETGRLFFGIGNRLGLDWLRDRGRRVAAGSRWQRLAATAIVDELYDQQMALAIRVATQEGGEEGWAREHHGALERHAQLLAELRGRPEFDMAMLTVANRGIRALVPY